jgi:hypothetical protein
LLTKEFKGLGVKIKPTAEKKIIIKKKESCETEMKGEKISIAVLTPEMPPAAGAAAAAERARTDLHEDADARRRRPGTIWRWNADVEGRERDRAAARVASADTSSVMSMPPRGLGEETRDERGWMADDCSLMMMRSRRLIG